MPVIEVSHLTKEYRLGAMQGLKQTLLNTAARLFGKKVEERPLFKALDDVSFSIEQGEVVGIIGHNGAGKSTLLKMLAKISTPTRGSVKVDGRIAPLIEVGAGFVPDFTGRENVYLNGAILGMSKQEIEKKFDEIVDFAEMAEFIDTPVKRYSSGMQVKLAFAVATSMDSEILIVSEWKALLSVMVEPSSLSATTSDNYNGFAPGSYSWTTAEYPLMADQVKYAGPSIVKPKNVTLLGTLITKEK